MSTETLSQQEIDLLFGKGGAGTQTSAEPAPPRAAKRDVQVYDFRRPNRISKDRQRSLDAMYALLTKSMEGWLSGRVRGQIELTLLAVEQLSYGEFLLSLETPCASYVFDLEGTGQQAIVDFGQEFAFFLVDRLLGGTGTFAPQDRALTPLERLIVRMVAERTAYQLGEIWQDHVALAPAMNRFESMPEMLQIVNREDPVLVANIQVSSGTMRSLLLVCVPFVVLEKFFTGPGSRRLAPPPGNDGERALDRVAVETTVRMTGIPVSVRLPGWRMALGELAALEAGSMLVTPFTPATDVEVVVSGRRRFRGTAGRSGRHVAVSIGDSIDETESDAPTAAR